MISQAELRSGLRTLVEVALEIVVVMVFPVPKAPIVTECKALSMVSAVAVEFRAAFRRRRCLVPADGWLEWREEESGKQPWFIAAAGGAPLSFAGLWERWEKGGEPIETFTILTTATSPGLIAIHDRQPTIIKPDDFDEWLAPDTPEERRLALARSAYEGPYDRWPVSRRVNNPRNEGPDLVQPLDG